MKFESSQDSAMELLKDLEAKSMTDTNPPKFERGSGEGIHAGNDAVPPKMSRANISFGGSVEVSARKTDVENAKNDIQLKHAVRDLNKQIEKDKAAEQAYRDKLYGKK